jgi:hypothetical protein
MPGPSPMPAPPLLEAVNQNSLAVFLLVRSVPPPPPPPPLTASVYVLIWECSRGCGTAGERGDGRGEPVHADYVCLERTCDVRAGSVCVWHVCVRVGDAGTSGMEIVKREDARRGCPYGDIHNVRDNALYPLLLTADLSQKQPEMDRAFAFALGLLAFDGYRWTFGQYLGYVYGV